jgi:hypothetical protein
MSLEGKTDEHVTQVVRCAVGFTYAHFQNRIIGEDPIILKRAGKNGHDLRYAATWEFIEENHIPGRFGYGPEANQEMFERVSNSNNPVCVDARNRLRIATGIICRSGSAIDPLILAAQFNRKDGSQPLVLIREEGWGPTIDALTPVFNWYQEEGRKDFVWPGEGRVRFEGYGQVVFNQRSDGIELSAGYERGNAIIVPFDKIRKVRIGGFGTNGGRDIWRNPALYHVNLSHENEIKFEEEGRVTIELREDQSDVTTWADLLSKKPGTLKRAA